MYGNGNNPRPKSGGAGASPLPPSNINYTTGDESQSIVNDISNLGATTITGVTPHPQYTTADESQSIVQDIANLGATASTGIETSADYMERPAVARPMPPPGSPARETLHMIQEERMRREWKKILEERAAELAHKAEMEKSARAHTDPSYWGGPFEAGTTSVFSEGKMIGTRPSDSFARSDKDFIGPQMPLEHEGVFGFGIIDTTLKTLGGSAPGTFETLGAAVDDFSYAQIGGRIDDTIGNVKDMWVNRPGKMDTPLFYIGGPQGVRINPDSPIVTDFLQDRADTKAEEEQKYLERRGLEDTFYAGTPQAGRSSYSVSGLGGPIPDKAGKGYVGFGPISVEQQKQIELKKKIAEAAEEKAKTTFMSSGLFGGYDFY